MRWMILTKNALTLFGKCLFLVYIRRLFLIGSLLISVSSHAQYAQETEDQPFPVDAILDPNLVDAIKKAQASGRIESVSDILQHLSPQSEILTNATPWDSNGLGARKMVRLNDNTIVDLTKTSPQLTQALGLTEPLEFPIPSTLDRPRIITNSLRGYLKVGFAQDGKTIEILQFNPITGTQNAVLGVIHNGQIRFALATQCNACHAHNIVPPNYQKIISATGNPFFAPPAHIIEEANHTDKATDAIIKNYIQATSEVKSNTYIVPILGMDWSALSAFPWGLGEGTYQGPQHAILNRLKKFLETLATDKKDFYHFFTFANQNGKNNNPTNINLQKKLIKTAGTLEELHLRISDQSNLVRLAQLLSLPNEKKYRPALIAALFRDEPSHNLEFQIDEFLLALPTKLSTDNFNSLLNRSELLIAKLEKINADIRPIPGQVEPRTNSIARLKKLIETLQPYARSGVQYLPDHLKRKYIQNIYDIWKDIIFISVNGYHQFLEVDAIKSGRESKPADILDPPTNWAETRNKRDFETRGTELHDLDTIPRAAALEMVLWLMGNDDIMQLWPSARLQNTYSFPMIRGFMDELTRLGMIYLYYLSQEDSKLAELSGYHSDAIDIESFISTQDNPAAPVYSLPLNFNLRQIVAYLLSQNPLGLKYEVHVTNANNLHASSRHTLKSQKSTPIEFDCVKLLQPEQK